MPTKKKTTRKATKKVAKKATKKTTRKTAKKKTTRKTAKRSTKTTRKTAKKALIFASDGESFWVKDGQILNNLVSLRDALERMDKQIYAYHVSNDNDFARWVDVVLCDSDCAKDLRRTKTPKSARTVVVKHLKYYSV
jgi:hypothetical protein